MVQIITTKPPTIYDLLELKNYRDYFKINPSIPDAVSFGKQPWQVWAYKQNGVARNWDTECFSTYREAWADLVREYKDRYYDDIAIVCKPVLFPRPATCSQNPDHYPPWDFRWCNRCRRPSWFDEYPNHHALCNAPVVETEIKRCFYCGVRESYLQHEKR